MSSDKQVYIPEELHKSLKARAAVEGVGLNSLATIMLYKGFEAFDIKLLVEESKKNEY